MDITFFTTDNKSGYKTNEKWLSKNHPDLYKQIFDYASTIPFELNFKEKIWFFFNKLTERPKCKTCGNEIKFRNRFDKPYGEFCTLDCINTNKTEMLSRIKKSFNEKYGIDYYPQHSDFIKKQKKTKLEKYGNENYTNYEKGMQTKLEKYGNFTNLKKIEETCLKKYGAKSYVESESFKNKAFENFKFIYKKLNIIKVKDKIVTIKCNDCQKEYEINKQVLYERNKRNQVICTLCNPIGMSNRSGHENDLCEFLDSLNIEYNTNNRKLISKELDVYIPSKSLAIEINGLYWHSELFVTDNYHLNKTIECNNKNIQLMHIFEDEWFYKKDIVKSILKNKLGLIDKKIYARKCSIKEIDSSTAREFLDSNHIQGAINSKLNIGLFHKGELVSLMCFSHGRIIMGGKPNEWELTRFSNIIDTNVIGAANKLFNYFLETYKPQTIVSYSDLRLFTGNMYSTLGFKKIRVSKPNYWYVKNERRYHRFNFRKSILIKEGFDQNLTEKEIMFNRKYYRIYDCGNVRWEFNN